MTSLVDARSRGCEWRWPGLFGAQATDRHSVLWSQESEEGRGSLGNVEADGHGGRCRHVDWPRGGRPNSGPHEFGPVRGICATTIVSGTPAIIIGKQQRSAAEANDGVLCRKMATTSCYYSSLHVSVRLLVTAIAVWLPKKTTIEQIQS